MKRWLTDFPTQGGTVFVALALILVTGLIIAGRLLRGLNFPNGYETWLLFLGALAGVSTAGMVAKRVTGNPDVIRAEGDAKAAVEAARTTGTFTPNGTPPVTAPEVVVPLTHRDSEAG